MSTVPSATSNFKMRSSAVLAMKSCVPVLLKARPLAPNGGKPWLPGVSRSCAMNVDTVPAGRSSLNTLPPKESETDMVCTLRAGLERAILYTSDAS